MDLQSPSCGSSSLQCSPVACRDIMWDPATRTRRGEVRRASALYLLARMTMSIPQNMLMIQPTMTMAVRIWMRAAAMFSQKTQHMCRSGRSVRAPHSTVNADTNVPGERAAAQHPVRATASCQIPPLRPAPLVASHFLYLNTRVEKALFGFWLLPSPPNSNHLCTARECCVSVEIPLFCLLALSWGETLHSSSKKEN